MRLISQDGKGDMPYENFIFRACGGDIVASKDILTNERQIVARYFTEAKALKVMEMLQEEYRFKKLFETLCSGMGDYPNKPFYYFQFPQDEDVEV